MSEPNLDPLKPNPDKYDLEANEKLMAAKAYILFTVENKKAIPTFHYDPEKLSDIELLGFLTIAINQLSYIKNEIEMANVYMGDDEDDCPGKGDCDNCDLCDEDE